jgi:glycerol-3-phosphate dehydrogenase (NAD(P)+)
MRRTLEAFAPYARDGVPIVLCSKGVEQKSLKLMTDVLHETAPNAAPVVLSGPSFAGEVARGLPTAVTLATPNDHLGRALAAALATPTFRPYLASDMIGAEAGGAIKNVLAIACGIVEGRGLGRSAHAAVITRGFAEMTRFAVALGAEAETLNGLCGLGDLVLTCSSPQSRNMSFGLELGRGAKPADILAARNGVTEGAESAPAVVELGRRLGVDLPICDTVNALIDGRLDARAALDRLLNRPFREES